MRQIILTVLLILTACSAQKETGTGEYLLPWADADGTFHLRKIFIETLSAPDRASGPAAEIFYQPNFTDQGLTGAMAQPRVTYVNGVYVPRDVPSAMALTVYAILERIQKFDRRIQPTKFGPVISWPRRIGIEMQLIDARTQAREHDNARYYGDQDTMILFPYSGSEIPLVLNPAILAHEHFHAFFHNAVISVIVTLHDLMSALDMQFYPHTPLSPSLKDEPKELEQMDFNRPEDFNLFVLRAWNEGLADFYSTTYTKSPHMISASLAFKGLDERNLDGKFSGLLTAESFRDQLQKGQRENLEKSAEWCQSTSCAYRQGTQFARLLYQFSGDRSEQVLAQIIRNLPKLSDNAVSALSTRFMEMDEAIGLLLTDVPLDKRRCETLRKAVSHQTMTTRFAACASF